MNLHPNAIPCVRVIVVPCSVCHQLTETTNASAARHYYVYCEDCRAEARRVANRRYYLIHRKKIRQKRKERYDALHLPH